MLQQNCAIIMGLPWHVHFGDGRQAAESVLQGCQSWLRVIAQHPV
jgi:hypothetical protein